MEIILTSQNFNSEVLKSSIPVVVDVYAAWCGPCKMMGPVFESLATEMSAKYKFGKYSFFSREFNEIKSKSRKNQF